MLKNNRLLQALRREPVDRTPVWIMRQAGRYLPEYRAVRQKAGDFLNLVKNPDLACEVTLQPLERFPLDAAILFSDILTIPDALGLGLHFETGEGPIFDRPIRTEADLLALPELRMDDDLQYVGAAVRTIKSALNNRCPLIGFSGSPWTLATYMVEGSSSKTFSRIKAMLYSQPSLLQGLLDKLTTEVTKYCAYQIQSGVQVMMLFDTWGGILTPSAYRQYSLSPMRQIIHKLREQFGDTVPIVLFTKNGGQWLEEIITAQPHAVGIDWTTDIGNAFDRVGNKVAIQGNLDPSILYGSNENIQHEVRSILAKVAGRPGHVFNLGHGIHPDISPDKVAVMIDTVQQYELTQVVA